MLLPGQMDAAPSGAFTYTVPITVAPGTAGMVPSLSLEYSSQSGDGIVGLGWSLAGLPSIGRCPRTVAQDTIKGSVNYDANDRFCMEGQRLIAISGTYGANNTEYRTEIEGFSKVVSYGTAGTGPSYFKVWTKSGQIMEFGNTTDSRLLAQGITTARSWAVNKISDTKGNYLTVTYTNDTTNGQAYPTRVDYTGNAGASLAPYNSVRFTYNTSRPDQVPLYHAGSLQKTTVLLTNVKTHEGNNVVRDYQITYELGTSTRRSRVTQIKVCDNAANCLAPTTFGWQGTRDTVTLTAATQGSTLASISVGDMNGDGLTDYRWIDNQLFYNGTETGFTGGSYSMCQLNDGGPLADITADGYADFLTAKLVAGTFDPEKYTKKWCINNRAGGTTNGGAGGGTSEAWESAIQFNFQEFNGDGLLDYIKINKFYINNGDGTFTASTGTVPVGSWFDADGDGCSDRYNTNTIYLSTYCPAAVASFTLPNWAGYALTIGDFNGDGIPDYLKTHPTAAGTLHLGTGRGATSTSSFASPAGWSKYEIDVADFNGDGKQDLALIAATSISGGYGVGTPHQIWLSTGTGFVLAASITHTNAINTLVKTTIADWNHNGAADIWFSQHSGDVIHNAAYTPELMNSVSNGLGITTTVTYDRINKPAVYTKDTNATYPTIDIASPLYVVSRVDSGNGVGGTYSSTYKYVGLKADQSRGFLGFRQRIITDLQTNVVETTTFRQDFPYLGLVASQTKTRSAVTLNSKTNSFASSNPGVGRYLVTLSQTVEVSNDLNGAALPTITTAYQYDAFANPTQVGVTMPDGSSKVTNSTYSNDTTNWLLGRLLTANQTNTIGGNSVTRQTSYAYNATSGLLTQEVVEPNAPTLRLQSDYTYDAFGNKLTATLSGIDIVTRSSAIGYDTQGRFATSATNALNQIVSQASDARHGGKNSSTDLNGLASTTTFDAFGRPTLSTSPDGTKVSAAYAYCSGVNGGIATCVAGGKFVIASTVLATDGTTQIGPQTKTYFDALARPIADDTQGFDGATVRMDTQYDVFGRIAQVSRPYFVTGGVPKWIGNTFDEIGRIVAITQPNGGQTTTVYSGLTATVTNALNQTTTTVRDSRGQIASVTDNAGTTTYTYDQFDNVKTVTDSAGNVTTFSYDTRGRKIAASDPDMGIWQYSYNVLGEIVSQSDAKNQSVALSYDKLGRLTQRVEIGLTSTFTYDTAFKGLGKIAADSASNGASHTYNYDSLGRPSAVATTVDGNSYTATTTYDANGRPNVVTYPSGFAIRYEYTSLGYLYRLINNATSTALWTANAVNAELQVTQQMAGNGVVTDRVYDSNTGLVSTIHAGVSNTVANFSFGFNTIGSLTSRTDAINSVTEDFTYDSMNRLTQYAIQGGSTRTVGYDALGNITSKSDVGIYAYPTAATPRPHAIGSITGAVNTIFTYDANGNMIAGNGRTVTYTSFNMAESITQGSSTVSFAYDANRERIKQVAPEGTTLYIGGGVERFAATSGLVQWNEYLMAGKLRVGVHITRSDATQNTRYFVTDHLGSISVLTDEAGAVVERLSYDAWGKRRHPNGADDPTGSITSQTTRGFTGHEHIASVGLINMNARIYDPQLGRFMTPDSLIDDIYLSQILNRFTYVGNNPLSIVDPTGRSWLSSLFRRIPILRAIVAIAVAVVFQQWEVFGFLGSLGNAVVGGLLSGYISGGTLQSALLGGLKVLAFSGIHEIKEAAGILDKLTAEGVIMHGLVGGLLSVAQGGNFASGFLAAGFGELATPLTGVDFSVKGVIVSSLAGGVGAVLGGGKFENGAITGAFGYLFNEFARDLRGLPPRSLLIRLQQDVASRTTPGAPYSSGNEWGGWIYQRPDGSWDYTIVPGGSEVQTGAPPPGAKFQWHSHPPYSDQPIDNAQNIGQNRASYINSNSRPGDIQGWMRPDWRDRYTQLGIQGAFIFGPTEVNYYAFSSLTGAPSDVWRYTTVLSGSDVSWPRSRTRRSDGR